MKKVLYSLVVILFICCFAACDGPVNGGNDSVNPNDSISSNNSTPSDTIPAKKVYTWEEIAPKLQGSWEYTWPSALDGAMGKGIVIFKRDSVIRCYWTETSSGDFYPNTSAGYMVGTWKFEQLLTDSLWLSMNYYELQYIADENGHLVASTDYREENQAWHDQPFCNIDSLMEFDIWHLEGNRCIRKVFPFSDPFAADATPLPSYSPSELVGTWYTIGESTEYLEFSLNKYNSSYVGDYSNWTTGLWWNDANPKSNNQEFGWTIYHRVQLLTEDHSIGTLSSPYHIDCLKNDTLHLSSGNNSIVLVRI